MVFRCAPWPRPHHDPSASIARSEFFLFFEEEPSDGGRTPMELAGWSPYDAWPSCAGVSFQARAEEATFFDSMIGVAEEMIDLDGGLSRTAFDDLKRSMFCARVETAAEDPSDLGHLQFAWATARLLIELGASCVCDATGGRWFTGAEVLAWTRGVAGDVLTFSIQREVRIDVAREPEAMVLSTGGMAKFGRPDLFFFESLDIGIDWIAQSVIGLANELAMGRVISAEDTVTLGGRTYVCALADDAAESLASEPTDLVLTLVA